MKRLFGLVLSLLLAVTACSPDSASSQGSADKPLQIGIAQIVDHPSLNALRDGFMEAMTDAGYVEGTDVVYDLKNAAGDQVTLSNIASSFTDKDLVVAIATPTAITLAQALPNTPLFFAGVTDPVGAGLVNSVDAPGGMITGTSDMPPIADQLELIKQITPDVSTVGLLYTSGEVNSQIQAQMVKDAAPALGLAVQEATVTASSEVRQGAESLSGADSFFVGTDNTIISGVEALVAVAEERKVPLYVSDPDSVDRGAMAALAVDYHAQGVQTGEMAAQYLAEGGKPGDIPVAVASDLEISLNLQAAERMGVVVPQDVIDKAVKVVR
ncbi:ABC transporter substrate-binding protein [Brooklawnia sp.]|uniref:ABC transporter substrate-binding protein n=1 Tax=Brooklawnia sp. TaxID=2699740 RepID=UPI00311D46F8